MFKVFPYKLGSQSARLLSRGLGAIRVRPDGRYRYRRGHVVINWGSSTVPNWLTPQTRIINRPEAVGIASHKVRCFQVLSRAGVAIVPFTTSWREAMRWVGSVYVRTVLQGHSGEGIEIYNESQTLPHAPLYTKKVQNHGEYRVHVMNGEVIGYRKKSRRHEDTPSEAQNAVRTLGNGWIYRSGQLERLERVEELAVRAIDALGLDFGAVDIIMDENGEVFVLEVNTAVGLSDSTLQEYISGFNRNYNA